MNHVSRIITVITWKILRSSFATRERAIFKGSYLTFHNYKRTLGVANNFNETRIFVGHGDALL